MICLMRACKHSLYSANYFIKKYDVNWLILLYFNNNFKVFQQTQVYVLRMWPKCGEKEGFQMTGVHRQNCPGKRYARVYRVFSCVFVHTANWIFSANISPWVINVLCINDWHHLRNKLPISLFLPPKQHKHIGPMSARCQAMAAPILVRYRNRYRADIGYIGWTSVTKLSMSARYRRAHRLDIGPMSATLEADTQPIYCRIAFLL